MLNRDNLPDRETDADPPQPVAAVLDDLAEARWVQAYDSAWLGGDWSRLAGYLAADVALLTDLKGRAAGDLGIVSYCWQPDWTMGHRRQQISGRDLLMLRAAAAGWQLLRRLPLDT